jgi:hypothetical protein
MGPITMPTHKTRGRKISKTTTQGLGLMTEDDGEEAGRMWKTKMR